jgi:chaperonin cofactor prefoldin
MQAESREAGTLGPSLFITGTGMRVNSSFLAIALAVATPAMAQPAGQVDATACKAEEEALEQDMAIARSRGQMLRRRELAEALAALQARCKTLSPAQSRAARIERLEREIRGLRLELERAEEELRELTRGG